MTISIQPLDSNGQETDKTFHAEWNNFLSVNDGFSPEEIARMTEILEMGSGYLLGGGAAGAFRLKKVS